MFFHFNTLRKYTGTILNLFSNLETFYISSQGRTIFSKIPIQYSNKEKFEIIDQLSYNEIYTGNNLILPRGILIFSGMSVARDREKNKFSKIYSNRKESDVIKYQFSSIPYNFDYQVVYQARGMNEACMIVEQVCSYFNPSYCARVLEVELENFEPTNIIIDLANTSIEQSDIDEFSTNIVTITFDLVLRGNIYPAIRDHEIIKKIQLFLNDSKSKNEIQSSQYKEELPEDFNNIPEIRKNSILETEKYIEILDIISKNDFLEVRVDNDNIKLLKLKYEWYLNDKLLPFNEYRIPLKINNNDKVSVKAVTDYYESAFFNKIFTNSDIQYTFEVLDIKYDSKFLEVDFIDKLAQERDIKYRIEWYIDGVKIRPTTRIIKYLDDFREVSVIINTSDSRKTEFTKVFN